MPISITVPTTLLAIRATASESNIAPQIYATGLVYFNAARSMIERYAPLAPDSVQDAAMVRLVGWMWDSPTTDSFSNKAMMHSGAASILSQWREHSVGIIGDSGVAEDSPGRTSFGVTAEQVIGLISVWARAGSLEEIPDEKVPDSIMRDAELTASAVLSPNGVLTLTLSGEDILIDLSTLGSNTQGDDAYDWATVGNTEIIPSTKLPAVVAPSGTYVLPAAASGVRGGVQAVTNSIIDTGTSTGIFGWAISHVKKLVKAEVSNWAEEGNIEAIPANKLTNAPAGTSTGGGGGVPIIKTLAIAPGLSGQLLAGSTKTDYTSAAIDFGDIGETNHNVVVWLSGVISFESAFRRCDVKIQKSIDSGVTWTSSSNAANVDVEATEVGTFESFALSDSESISGTIQYRALVESHGGTSSGNIYVQDIFLTGIAFPAGASIGGGTSTGDDAFDWATVGNMDIIPIAKLPAFATKAYVDALVAGGMSPSVRSELIYYGRILAANAADEAAAITYAETIDVSTLVMADAAVAGHNITLGPSADSDFFLILVPATHDLLTLINTGTGGDALSAWSLSENARNDLGTPSEQYNSYVFGPLNPSVVFNYRLTLTE